MKKGVGDMEKTPEREAAERAVVARYEWLLRLYALKKRLPRECWGLWAVEGGIIGAFERGIEDKDLALGIAVVRANVGIGEFGLAVITDGAYSKEEAHKVMERMTEREIKKAAWWLTAWWLTQIFRRPELLFSRPKRPRREYEERLRDLNQRWDQMPIVNPLPA